jgi:hypothetical protein
MDPFKPQPFNYSLGEQTQNSVAKVKAQPPSNVNFFAFELDSRNLIDQLLKPVISQQLEDRRQVLTQQSEIQRLQ